MDRDEAFQRVVVGELAEIRKAARTMAFVLIAWAVLTVIGVAVALAG